MEIYTEVRTTHDFGKLKKALSPYRSEGWTLNENNFTRYPFVRWRYGLHGDTSKPTGSKLVGLDEFILRIIQLERKIPDLGEVTLPVLLETIELGIVPGVRIQFQDYPSFLVPPYSKWSYNGTGWAWYYSNGAPHERCWIYDPNKNRKITRITTSDPQNKEDRPDSVNKNSENEIRRSIEGEGIRQGDGKAIRIGSVKSKVAIGKRLAGNHIQARTSKVRLRSCQIVFTAIDSDSV